MNASALLLSASLLIAPVLHAQDTGKNTIASERKAKREARLLAKFDANHNGVLDPDERAALEKFEAERKAERIAKFDKNGNGKLDKSERAAMRRAHKRNAKGNHKEGAISPALSGTTSAPAQ
jgi:hypothetical protein